MVLPPPSLGVDVSLCAGKVAECPSANLLLLLGALGAPVEERPFLMEALSEAEFVKIFRRGGNYHDLSDILTLCLVCGALDESCSKPHPSSAVMNDHGPNLGDFRAVDLKATTSNDLALVLRYPKSIDE
jgi:hypothetical protein